MESLFLGTPIVMRDVDANHTLVKDGFNGVLFKEDIDLPDAMIRAANLKVDDYQDDLLPICYRQSSQVKALREILGI